MSLAGTFETFLGGKGKSVISPEPDTEKLPKPPHHNVPTSGIR
jgi:hypothetical protein